MAMKILKLTPILLGFPVYIIGLIIYLIYGQRWTPFQILFIIIFFVFMSMLLLVERMVLACCLEVNIKKLWIMETIFMFFVLIELYWVSILGH